MLTDSRASLIQHAVPTRRHCRSAHQLPGHWQPLHFSSTHLFRLRESPNTRAWHRDSPTVTRSLTPQCGGQQVCIPRRARDARAPHGTRRAAAGATVRRVRLPASNPRSIRSSGMAVCSAGGAILSVYADHDRLSVDGERRYAIPDPQGCRFSRCPARCSMRLRAPLPRVRFGDSGLTATSPRRSTGSRRRSAAMICWVRAPAADPWSAARLRAAVAVQRLRPAEHAASAWSATRTMLVSAAGRSGVPAPGVERPLDCQEAVAHARPQPARPELRDFSRKLLCVGRKRQALADLDRRQAHRAPPDEKYGIGEGEGHS